MIDGQTAWYFIYGRADKNSFFVETGLLDTRVLYYAYRGSN
jgi:hypothetical protein